MKSMRYIGAAALATAVLALPASAAEPPRPLVYLTLSSDAFQPIPI
jgi:hypothetical protein